MYVKKWSLSSMSSPSPSCVCLSYALLTVLLPAIRISPREPAKNIVCVCLCVRVYERKKSSAALAMYNCRTYKHVNRAAITAHFAHSNQFLFISIQPSYIYIYFFLFGCVSSAPSKKRKICRRKREGLRCT